LGYKYTILHIRRKSKGKAGIFDDLLLNIDYSFQVVVEVKKPGETLTVRIPIETEIAGTAGGPLLPTALYG